MAGRIIGVDVGGTFTDVVAIADGRILTAKVPTNPTASETSVLAGADEVDVGKASVFNLASTAGLNAIITRALPKIAVLTTEGHRDILDGGRIGRPIEALLDPGWRRGFGDSDRPLVPRYLRRGIRERIVASGDILIPLDEEQARRQLRVLKRCDLSGIAVCLLHAYANSGHELRLLELIREELGGIRCSLSSEVSPLAKEYVRSSTTVIDVLMKVMYAEYTDRLEYGLSNLGFVGQFNYADSRAMLLASDYAMERPYKLAMGGPAAGTASSAHFGGMIGDENLLCADVGGTSCDISAVLDGVPWSTTEFEMEFDLVVSSPATEVVTLGAGGGSIVAVSRAGDIQTGPASAGADPGPACYGAGGTRPTLTDTALLMGIIAPDGFLGGKKMLFPDLAVKAFESLETNQPFEQRVQFAWAIGLNNIAEGLLNIVIRRGIDPRDFSLMAFGAAGPMLLPSVLDLLPMRRVIVPPHPGLFSALGMVSSDRVYSDHRCAYQVLNDGAAKRLNDIFGSMEAQLLARVTEELSTVRIVRSFDGRLVGQNWETPFIPVPPGPLDEVSLKEMVGEFHNAYERMNGNRFETIPVEGVTYRVQVIVPSEKVVYDPVPKGTASAPARSVPLRYLYGDEVIAAEYERRELGHGDFIEGPAIIREEMSTTFVPMNRRAKVGIYGELVIE
jgi:N-methylhydantoinase A